MREYTRLLLHPRTSRPQMALAIYPDTEDSVLVTVTSTTIDFTFGSVTASISFVGKTTEEIATDINRTEIPVRAVALSRSPKLSADDIIGPSVDTAIPAGFPVYERLPNGGVVLRTTGFAISYRSLARIKLLPPHSDSAGLPWLPRISVGSFSIEHTNRRRFHFGIPEYKNQVWSPLYGRPIKDVRGAYVTILEDGAIQVPRYPIFWESNNILLYSDEAPLSSAIIEDVDVYNGLIYVKKGTLLTENVTVDYSYIETAYEYPYLNVNAHFSQNPFLLNKFVVFYLVPLESTVSARRKRSVYHSIGVTLDEAIDSIRPPTDPELPYVVIGAYHIQQVSPAFRTTVLDTRVLGGGLVDVRGLKSPVHPLPPVPSIDEPVSSRKIEDVYNDSASYYDIGRYDGIPYPGAAAIVMDLPSDLRLILSEKEIRDRAAKFVAAGVYPLIELSDRSGKYISGINTDISMAQNLDFSQTLNGKSGLFWYQANYTIPSGTVMVPWSSSFDGPTYNILSGNIIETSPDTGYYQPYLKSSPTAVISWKERTLISGPSNKDPNPSYSEWKERKIADIRDVPSGMLTKGFISLGSDTEVKQYKDISIYSPYRTDYTGNLLRDMVTEVARIFKKAESLIVSGTASPSFIGKKVSDVTNGSTTEESDYVGIHRIYDSIFSLAGDSMTAPIFSGLAISAETGFLASFDSTYMVKLYDVSAGDFTTSATYEISLPQHLETVGSYVKYASLAYGSGDIRYHSGWYGLAVAAKVMEEVGALPPSSPWIEPDYSANAGGPPIKIANIAVETGYANISSSNEDHRILEILPSLMKPYAYAASLSTSHLNSISGGIENLPSNPLPSIPGYVYNSFTGTIPTIKALLTGEMKDAAGNLVASGWFSPHDRLGEFAGNLMLDAYHLTERLLVGISYAGGEGTESGLRLQDVSGYRDKVKEVLDLALPTVEQNLIRGGIVDPFTVRLLEVYGMWAGAGFRDDATGGSLFNIDGVHKVYSGLYASGVKVLLRDAVSPEGDMQQRRTAFGEWQPGSGIPPADYVRLLSAGVTITSDYIPALQAAFNMLTGNYSYSGAYPVDATLSGKEGGFEPDVLKALEVAISRISSLYPAVDALSLYRNL